MNVRDYATSLFLELQNIRRQLDAFEDLEDFDESVSIAQEISSDLDSLAGELDSVFELGMDEE
jgi:hypothetical protein